MMGKSVKEGIMPKEFIHCRDFGRLIPTAEPDENGKAEVAAWDSNAVKVGWSKEHEHVEIAVVQSVDGAFAEHGYLLEAGAEIDCDERVRLERLTPQYIQMDRYGLNRLIKVLRQARDDAFGRDE